MRALEAFNFDLPYRSGITLINVIYDAVKKVLCRWKFRLQKRILCCLTDFKEERGEATFVLVFTFGNSLFHSFKSIAKVYLVALPKRNASFKLF